MSDTTVTADLTVDQLLEAQRDRLLAKLAVQRRHSAVLWAWYHGEQDNPVTPSRYRDAYKLLIGMARTPWARLVVDTIAERLHVQGFRSLEAEQDTEAWRLFNQSAMNADERLVYQESLVTGLGYVSVNGDGELAPESTFEVTHEPQPGSRRQLAAALKVYPADPEWRLWACELLRPDATYRWTAILARPLASDSLFPIDVDLDMRDRLDWQPADPYVQTNPLGVVPVVAFENRATILGGGVSELKDCIPLLQRIDRLTLDMLLASEYSSFRQKWATGLEVPKDPDTGKPVEPFKAAVNRLWISENPDTKFGTFDASDLGGYLSAIDSQIAALAAISRVPAHYLLQSNLANPPSAESLVAAESGLVAKVRERQRRFGEAWEHALALALDATGSTPGGMEVVWQDAEMRNPAQVADAAVKLQTIGVPQRALWEYVGATPQQLNEWTLEAAATDLTTLAGGPGGGGGPTA
jgi:hypothetical protein